MFPPIDPPHFHTPSHEELTFSSALCWMAIWNPFLSGDVHVQPLKVPVSNGVVNVVQLINLEAVIAHASKIQISALCMLSYSTSKYMCDRPSRTQTVVLRRCITNHYIEMDVIKVSDFACNVGHDKRPTGVCVDVVRALQPREQDAQGFAHFQLTEKQQIHQECNDRHVQS